MIYAGDQTFFFIIRKDDLSIPSEECKGSARGRHTSFSIYLGRYCCREPKGMTELTQKTWRRC